MDYQNGPERPTFQPPVPDTPAPEPTKPADSRWKIVPLSLLFGMFALVYYGIKNRKRGHGRGNVLLGIAGAWAAFIVIAIAVGVGAGMSDTTTGDVTRADPVAAATPASSEPAQTNPVDPAPVREAVDDSGKFTSSCDLDLPSDFDGSYLFFANAKLKNTGNVGIKVKVVAVFDQATAENIVLRKTVRVPIHHSRTAKLKIPITQDQADGFQNSPDYFDGKACRVHATVVDTYGQPPYEDS